MNIRDHIIDEWKSAYKLATIIAATLVGLLDVAYESLPVVKEYLPEGWVKYAAAAIIIARLWKQKKESK